MSDLSSGEILAIIVSVVLFLILIISLYVCRLVYLHEHGKVPVKEEMKKKAMRRARSTTSTESVGSGSTDFFVDRRDFDQLFSGMDVPWENTTDDDIEAGLSSGLGEVRIDNPAFDSGRAALYDAAVIIQSRYRGYRYICQLGLLGNYMYMYALLMQVCCSG